MGTWIFVCLTICPSQFGKYKLYQSRGSWICSSSCACLGVSEAAVPSGTDRAEIAAGGGVLKAWSQPGPLPTSWEPQTPWLLAPGIILCFSHEIFSTFSKQLNNLVSQRFLCLGNSPFQGGSDTRIHPPAQTSPFIQGSWLAQGFFPPPLHKRACCVVQKAGWKQAPNITWWK